MCYVSIQTVHIATKSILKYAIEIYSNIKFKYILSKYLNMAFKGCTLQRNPRSNTKEWNCSWKAWLFLIIIITATTSIIIIHTRPRPAFGQLGLGGSSGGYSSHG